MPHEPLRQWFVPGDGIDRGVISSHIQFFLGNDATVRPGVGTGEFEGIDGYWIKAYRNLTTAMLDDLRQKTTAWRKEQNRTGTRGSHSPMPHGVARGSAPDMSTEPYVPRGAPPPRDSGRSYRQNGDSPMRDSPFPANPQPPRDRPHLPEQMQMDYHNGHRMPPMDHPDFRYPNGRNNYPHDPRPYPPDGRPYAQDGRPYSQDHSMQDAPYGWNPDPAQYAQDRYGPNYPPPPMDPSAPNFARQGSAFVPVTSAYEPPPGMAPPGRSESVPFGSPQYGGPPPGPPGRDQRDQREPPRFGPNDFPPDPRYPDPRYPHPGPPVSASAVPPRESITSPPQPSFPLPPNPYNDQYGRPVQPNFGPPGQEQGYAPPPPPPPREQGYNNGSKERLPIPPPPPEYNGNTNGNNNRDRRPPPASDTRDAQRRRMK